MIFFDKIKEYINIFNNDDVISFDIYIQKKGENLFIKSLSDINFEITAFIPDIPFIREVNQMLTEDFSKCTMATLEEFMEKPYVFKLACRTAKLMSPLQ